MTDHGLLCDATGDNAEAALPVSQASFADVIRFVTAGPGFTAKQRRDAKAAWRTLFKTIGREPADLALRDPEAQLDQLFKELQRAFIGPKVPSTRNIKYRCRHALRRYLKTTGYVPPQSPAPVPLSPEWRRVLDVFPKKIGFSPKRFVDFAASAGLSPSHVRPAVIECFAATLGDMKHSKRHLRLLISGWNVVVDHQCLPDLHRLAAPAPSSRKYAARCEDLSPALRADIEGYFGARARSGRRNIHHWDGAPTLKPSSAERSRRLLLQYLGMLQQQEIRIADFQCLSDAITLDYIELGVRAFHKRSGGETSSQLNNIVSTLSAIARHHLRWKQDVLDQMWSWFDQLRHPYHGMVPRNIRRLTVLREPRHRRQLLSLPQVLMQHAARSDNEHGAYLAQAAVAIELLLQTAMRIGNLSRLQFDEHVICSGVGQSSHVFVLVEASSVKNGEPIRVELPQDTARLLHVYRRDAGAQRVKQTYPPPPSRGGFFVAPSLPRT
jgi:integrase